MSVFVHDIEESPFAAHSREAGERRYAERVEQLRLEREAGTSTTTDAGAKPTGGTEKAAPSARDFWLQRQNVDGLNKRQRARMADLFNGRGERRGDLPVSRARASREAETEAERDMLTRHGGSR